MRLWDLRKTQKSTGSLLSFPLEKSSAPLEPWTPCQLVQNFGRDNHLSVQKLQRLESGGKLLLTCVQHQPNAIVPYGAHLVVDPIQETVDCLSWHVQHPEIPKPSCLVSLPDSSDKPSLLVHPSNSGGFDMVNIYGNTPLTQSRAPTAKRRKTSSTLGLPKMGNSVGTLRVDSVRDEYGLSSQLIEMAWDKRGYRLVGLSQDFDVFEWQL